MWEKEERKKERKSWIETTNARQKRKCIFEFGPHEERA